MNSFLFHNQSPLRFERLTGLTACLMLFAATLAARADLLIYTDSVQIDWQDWSWFSTRDFSCTTIVHSGSSSISVSQTEAWGAFALEHANIDTSLYTDLSFWINGGPTGGQLLMVYADSPLFNSHPQIPLPTVPANAWQQITLSLSSLGVANQPDFSRFAIMDRSGSGAATFYIDDIKLIEVPEPSTVGLVSTGLLGVLTVRRKNRDHKSASVEQIR